MFKNFLIIFLSFQVTNCFIVKNLHQSSIIVFYDKPVGYYQKAPYNRPEIICKTQFYMYIPGDIKEIDYVVIEPNDEEVIKIDEAHCIWFVDKANGFKMLEESNLACNISLFETLKANGRMKENTNKIILNNDKSVVTVFFDKEKDKLDCCLSGK